MIIIFIILGVGFVRESIDQLLFKTNDSVTALKIGQGDAILLQSKLGARVVVDGGPDNSVVYRLGNYLPLFDLSLDGIFVTHSDLDHVLGVVELMRRYEVDYLFVTDFVAEKFLGRLAIEEAKKNNINVISVKTGDIINLPGMYMQVLWPNDKLDIEDINDTSIVLQVDFQHGSALLTGDAGVEIEKILINHPELLNVDVLKAGHHGSKSSTQDDFVQTTSPQIAIISAGKDNKFGHPHQEVLDILASNNVMVLDNINQDLRIEFLEEGLNIP